MYRVNLYREYFTRRERTRRNFVRTVVLTSLVGFEVALVVGLFVSGLLLQERATALSSEIRRMSSQAQEAAVVNPEVELARDLLSVRESRLNWSPKLAALSRQMEPSLKLVAVTGQASRKGSEPRLRLEGFIRGPAGRAEPVLSLVDRLRREPAMVQDLPRIRLGTLGAGGSERFEVVCESSGKGS